MDEPRISTIREKIFFLIFPLIIFFFALDPYSVWHSQILITVTLAIFLGIDPDSYRYRFDRRSLWLFTLLTVLLFFSTLFSINKINSVPAFFSYLLIFFLLLNISEEKKPRLIKGYIYATLLLGFISSGYIISKILLTDTPRLFSILDSARNLIIPYFGHAFYAIFLLITFPFIIDDVWGKKSRSSYILFFIYSIFIVLSFSKAAIVIGLLQVLIFYRRYQASQDRVNSKSPMAGLFIIILLFISFISFLFFSQEKNSWLRGKIIKQSVPSRLEYLRQGLKIARQSSASRLLLGYGSDTFYDLSHRFQSLPAAWSNSMHNFLGQFVIENGILATLVLLLFLPIVFFRNFTAYTLAEKISIVSVFFHSMISTTSLNIFPILLFFFLILFKKREKLDMTFFADRHPLMRVTLGHWLKTHILALKLFKKKQKLNKKSNDTFKDMRQSRWQIWEGSRKRAEFFQPAAGSSTCGKEKSDRIYFAKFVNIFLLFILSLFWLRYVVAYTYFFALDKSNPEAILLFPYETNFWTKIISSNSLDTSELKKISSRLQKYSESNVELSSLLLTRAFEKKDYCQTIRFAKELLLIAPYDVAGQNQMMRAAMTCPDSQKDLVGYFRRIKSAFVNDRTSLVYIRPFLQFAAAANFNNGQKEEFQWWFSKAWLVKVVNNKADWLSELIDKPAGSLTLKGPFKVSVKLLTQNDLGGIVLQGRLQKEGGGWWEGIKSIFIGTRKDGQRLYIDTRDGLSIEATVLIDKVMGRKIQDLTIYFDQIGSDMRVVDENGQTIAAMKLPQPIFPDGKIFIGYGVAPNSVLSILDFSLSQEE